MSGPIVTGARTSRFIDTWMLAMAWMTVFSFGVTVIALLAFAIRYF